jgi:hypothetical protein
LEQGDAALSFYTHSAGSPFGPIHQQF